MTVFLPKTPFPSGYSSAWPTYLPWEQGAILCISQILKAFKRWFQSGDFIADYDQQAKIWNVWKSSQWNRWSALSADFCWWWAGPFGWPIFPLLTILKLFDNVANQPADFSHWSLIERVCQLSFLWNRHFDISLTINFDDPCWVQGHECKEHLYMLDNNPARTSCSQRCSWSWVGLPR